MVHKEPCPICKGNKYITVAKTTSENSHVKCPSCGGKGYKVRISH